MNVHLKLELLFSFNYMKYFFLWEVFLQNSPKLPKHVHFRLSSDDPIYVKRPSSFP